MRQDLTGLKRLPKKPMEFREIQSPETEAKKKWLTPPPYATCPVLKPRGDKKVGQIVQFRVTNLRGKHPNKAP